MAPERTSPPPTPNPFQKDDMYRPADEGRSLHDEIKVFIKEAFKMGDPSRVKPTEADFHGKFLALLSGDGSARAFQMIASSSKESILLLLLE